MKYRALHTTDSIGRAIVFEERDSEQTYSRYSRSMIPGTNDIDLLISTKKHGEITLGKLAIEDNAYVVWIVAKSKQTRTIKYAAIRILAGIPYEVPADGQEYDQSLFFDINNFKSLAEKLNIQI